MSAEEKARLAELESENARLKTEATATLAATRNAEHLHYAEGLIQAGKLLPVHKSFIVASLDFMAADTGVLEFSEADGTKKCQPALEGFKAFLDAQPKQVDFTEHSAAAGDTVDFADPNAIAKAATAYQVEQEAAGNKITHPQAVAHVMAGKA